MPSQRLRVGARSSATSGRLGEDVEPPERLNLTGIAWPELTVLNVGSLSTGAKKPANGYETV